MTFDKHFQYFFLYLFENLSHPLRMKASCRVWALWQEGWTPTRRHENSSFNAGGLNTHKETEQSGDSREQHVNQMTIMTQRKQT